MQYLLTTFSFAVAWCPPSLDDAPPSAHPSLYLRTLPLLRPRNRVSTPRRRLVRCRAERGGVGRAGRSGQDGHRPTLVGAHLVSRTQARRRILVELLPRQRR